MKEFDKHYYYERSVQNPEGEVEFLYTRYREIRNKEAYILREDFSGTAAIACKWASRGPEYKSFGIDLDPDPIEYGKKTHYAKLDEEAKKRMHYIQDDVFTVKTDPADIIFAFNFSYQIFKKRKELLHYFKSVYNSLNDDGVFFLDLFGGPDSQTVMTDVIKHKDFTYNWECQMFNPITNECRFAIHIKRKGEKKRENVFVYDWRLWGMMELRDILEDAGFSKTIGYWEGDDGDGGGDGVFYPTEEAENCDAWVTYIAAVK